MKRVKTGVCILLASVIALSLAACGNNTNDDLKKISRPEFSATEDQASFTESKEPVEDSLNVNGKRFNRNLYAFTADYNAEKKKRGDKDILELNSWRKNEKVEQDANGVDIQYWYYDDENVSFTASVENESGKLVNIGCGTTMSIFMGMTGDKNNSDIILGKAALMAQVVCGFSSESVPVLQDIFYRTTTGSSDSLWYKGFVFNMSTKEDKNDSKKNIMLFRVFPVTDDLKKEWKLTEYK